MVLQLLEWVQEEGDIIRGVNRQIVTSVGDLRSVIEDTAGVVALNVQRGNSSLYLVLRNPG